MTFRTLQQAGLPASSSPFRVVDDQNREYRAFPANAQFNARERKPISVPFFLGAGDGSPFANLLPKVAEGMRNSGCAHVETGLILGAVHYVVEDQPERVADMIERFASVNGKWKRNNLVSVAKKCCCRRSELH
jgi:pimeloyl-ACP methyl ester carboxylesterase